MKNELRNYLGSLFGNAPKTPGNDALFEELLANLYDRYDEQLVAGASKEEAYERSIAEIGDIRPLIEQNAAADGAPASETDAESAKGKKQTFPAAELRRFKRRRALWTAVAVMLFILWLVPTILWNDVISLFLFAAAGTLILVLLGNRTPDYADNSADTYDSDRLRRDVRISDILQAVGIALCVVCILPAAAIDSVVGAALMFLTVALGVGMIVFSTIFRPRKGKGKVKETGEPVPAVSCVSAEEKPKKRRNRWILPSVLIAVCLIIAVCIVLGVHFGFEFGIYAVNDDFDGYTEIGNGETAEAVSRLTVDWNRGNVTVQAYDGESIRITETVTSGKAEEKDVMRWGVKNGRLAVRHDEARNVLRIRWGEYPAKDLTIEIPRSMAAGMTSVKIESVSANVTVGGMTLTGGLDVDVVSGHLFCNSVTADSLNADSVSGHIGMTDCRFRAMDADSVSGNVTLKNVMGESLNVSATSGCLKVTASEIADVEFDSTSGNCELELTAAPRRIEVDTTGGDTVLVIGAAWTGFTADFDSVGGNWKGNVPVTQNGKERVYGDGSTRIDVNSTGGDLTVQFDAIS